MIRINDLSFSFDKINVLEGVTIEIPDGTILGLVGINGAGKSTLLRIMSGVYNIQSGQVEYDGNSPMLERTRDDIFFLPDDPYYTHSMTCNGLLKMYKSLYPAFDEGLFLEMLEKYELDRKTPIRNFSKGMRRRAYICAALAVKPKYLLLDEAFDGLDPLARKQVKDRVIELVEENNTTVIISSHSLRELEDFCDMFALLDGKRIKCAGDIAEKVGDLCKFQLAFAQEFDRSIFDSLGYKSISIKGRFVKIILEGDSAQVEERLKALGPAVIEQMPMTFEEAFISEVEREERS